MLQAGENKTVPTPGENLRKARWPLILSPKLILLQVGTLLLLVVGTVWLLRRGEMINEATHQAGRGRSLTELVALAVGSDISFEDSSRFLRILECTARDGDLRAGAVLDSCGTVVAHTDVARTGLQLPQASLGNIRAIANSTLMPLLFGVTAGRVFLHPLIGAGGPVGTVVLLIPKSGGSLLDPASLKFLVPAGLLLLAFVGLTKTTIRHAIKPASDFLERLTNSLEEEEASAYPDALGASPSAECGNIMDQTVSWVSSLNDARQTLTLENRVLDYDRRRKGLILDHLADGLVMTDPVEKVILVNRAAATMAGMAADEMVGREIEALPSDIAQMLREAQQSGQALHTISNRDEERQILSSRIPLVGSGGQMAGMLYMLRDVTAQQASLRAQGEFLSQISHELKAPLNTILTYIEALTEDNLLTQDERKEYSNTLNAEAQRMARLIGNLLQISRIQLGNLSAKFGFVKSTALIRDLTESQRPQAEARGLTLQVSVPDNLPALYGDKDLLGVALINLITNAIKYTPAGGRILVRAEAGSGDLTIEVKDTGIGIREEDRARIFERFARSDQEEVREQSGSGLGLSLVKEIAELHEGSITLESSPGQGSVFRLRLPRREVGARLDMGAA